jgi:sugar/nucleoside kinase (ribokinase family)
MLYIIPFLIFCYHLAFGNVVVGLGAAMTDNVILADESDLEYEGVEKGGWYEISHDRMRDILKRHEGNYETLPGGSAINVLKAISGLGIETRAIGRIGSDRTADHYNASLKMRGVRSFLSQGALPSGQVTCFVTSEGQRTFCNYFGSSQTDTPKITLDPAAFVGASHLHIEGYQCTDMPTMRQAISMAKQYGLTISLDLANQFVVRQFRSCIEEVLPSIDMLLSNSEEALELTGLMPHKALKQLSSVCPTVVITMSEHGAIAKSGNQQAFAPAIDVSVIDTTGAGDGFTGGFLTAFMSGAPLDLCLKQGCYLASFVIQHLGPEITDSQWEAIHSSCIATSMK